MKTTEEQIRDLLLIAEQRAPLAADAMPKIQRGIARSRQRRAGAVVAAAIAVAAAITVPVVVHGSPHSTELSLSPPKPIGMTRELTLEPTWLPSGLVETERFGQLRSASVPGDPTVAYAGRAFADHNDRGALVIDSSGPMAPGTGTNPVRVGKRIGLSWYDSKTKSYQIEVRWGPGHWLDVNTDHFSDNVAMAVRIAQSVVRRSMTLNVPIVCSECRSLNVFNVTGSPDDPYTLTYGPALEINIDRHPDRRPTTGSLGHGFYAHLSSLPHAKHPLSTARLTAIAKTVRMPVPPDYSWLLKRP